MTVALMTVTPNAALSAYRQAAASSSVGGGSTDFGATLNQALQQAVSTGHDADASAMNAVVNGGSLTHVVTAVSKAQLALQEVVAVRDKVVQAYQDVMRMSI